MHYPGILTQAIFASNLATGSGQSVVDLSSDTWTLSSPVLNSTVPASLPSQAHLDLYRAGIIGDPYHGLNDLNLRWIAETNWTYTSGPISGLSSEFESTWIVFEGLDTFANVSFCGRHIASTDNQFRQYAFDVSKAMRECNGAPILTIDFASATITVNAIAAEHSSERWPVNINTLFPNRWFMRKEQSVFCWDWGPAFAPVDQEKPWVVNASLDFVGTLPRHPRLSVEITDIESGEVLTRQPSNDHLYTVTIIVENAAKETARVTKRTGFRTIFLNQRNVTDRQLSQGISPGAHWHFEVNGKEFYAKGSNLIPVDAFWPRVTVEKMTRLFDAVIAGHQNMLRVWSSGAYLHDFIYDLWQERVTVRSLWDQKARD
ncbi:galactose-binding domain-like protein [Aspergillus heterothallicus]